jgi:NAD kinase
MWEKIILVTRKTPLEELTERLGTREQARFYLQQEAARFGAAGGPSFADYVAEDATYHAALDALRAAIPRGVRTQIIERRFLPTFTFGEREMVVTLGPDGLVVNTAKYLHGQPIFAVNPDPSQIEGVLLPYAIRRACASGVIAAALSGKASLRRMTMARARLADGQTLDAVNDLYIGQRTHVSARYRLQWGKRCEDQSSSGVLVSTGAGSTGWLRSAAAGALGISAALADGPAATDPAEAARRVRFGAEEASLRFCVREPWPSKTSAATIVYGTIGPGEALTLISQMPQNGVIFSDGVESDYLPFDSGAVARIEIADRKVHLLMPA